MWLKGGEGSSELKGTASSPHQREMKRKLKMYIAQPALDSEAPLVEVISGAAHFLLNRAWNNSHIKRCHLWRPHGDTDINSRRKTEAEEEAGGDDSFQALRQFGSRCSNLKKTLPLTCSGRNHCHTEHKWSQNGKYLAVIENFHLKLPLPQLSPISQQTLLPACVICVCRLSVCHQHKVSLPHWHLGKVWSMFWPQSEEDCRASARWSLAG